MTKREYEIAMVFAGDDLRGQVLPQFLILALYVSHIHNKVQDSMESKKLTAK